MPLTETLSQKYGPLPVWAWLGLGTAGLAGYLYSRQKQQAAAAAAANQNQLGDSSNLGTVPVSNLTTTGEPMPIQMGDTFVDVSPPSTAAPTPAPSGGISQGGSPPQKPPAAKLPAAPKPAPPKAASQQTVTVCAWPNWCGSLSGIAKHEWGNGNLWPAIYNANKAKIGSNPNLIKAGTVLVIPSKPA